jgi:Cu/Ag efflux protein CusF
MNKKTRILLAATFSIVLVTAAMAIPPATQAPTSGAAQAAAQTQSASGTISAVDKDSFTITLAPSKNMLAANPSQDAPKSMTFVVDKNTTIEGKLKVGANADVTYRDDNGSHVAIGVRVTGPQS